MNTKEAAERARLGDKDCFLFLCQVTYSDNYRAANRILRDADLTEQILEDVYRVSFDKFKATNHDEVFEGWIKEAIRDYAHLVKKNQINEICKLRRERVTA